MKKLLLISIVFLFAFTANVFAQTTDNADISATADVIAPISVTSGENLAFGTIFSGFTATLAIDDSDGSLIETNASEGSLGSFTISGSEGQSVDISFGANRTLTGSGDNTLTLDISGTEFGRYQDVDGADANFDPDSGTTFTLGSDLATILLGGEIIVPSDQAEEEYSGTITMTASYTDF